MPAPSPSPVSGSDRWRVTVPPRAGRLTPAADTGHRVNYIGVCRGGAPHQVRAMAEALGREVLASKYAPAMELHPILGIGGGPAEANVLAAWNVAG